jgi:predicted metal-binding protein
MLERRQLEHLFHDYGFRDCRWLPATDIVVAQWVRMKCTYGCDEYGKSVACPPNVPSVADCERFIREYSEAVIFRFEKAVPDREDRLIWSRGVNQKLLDLERAVFLHGQHKAFMLLMGGCPKCEECVGRPEDCRHPGSARPTPEGMAVDLFATTRNVGYPLDVLTDDAQTMNRYAILLVE